MSKLLAPQKAVKRPPVSERRKENCIVNLARNTAPGRITKDYYNEFSSCVFYGLNREKYLDKSRVNFTMIDESDAFVVEMRGVYVVPFDFIPGWVFWVLKKWFELRN